MTTTNRNSVTYIDNRTQKQGEFPILESVYGDDVVDIATMNRTLNLFSYDPGFVSTASCESAITYLDGDKGELLYRGYPIEQLAERSSYLDVCYLIFNGELPTLTESKEFENIIMTHSLMHENLKVFLQGFRYDSHPMAILAGTVASMAGFYHDKLDIHNPEHRMITAHRLISKMPTLVAAAYKHSIGMPMVYPTNSLSYAGNFMNMMFSSPCAPYEIDPIAEKAMDVLFILHADHEQNASTSTVRMAGSSGANPYAAISAGISSLWGASHGGANEAVLTMLAEIGSVENVAKFVAKAKDKEDPFRLMGFGHRVYKNFDPRAKLIKGIADEVLAKYGNDPLMEVAKRLEEVALKDEYFIERKLYPNVDFYSGIIYKALGFPTQMFTPLFALARTVGWITHWNEMIADPKMKISRPRQRYIGHTLRNM